MVPYCSGIILTDCLHERLDIWQRKLLLEAADDKDRREKARYLNIWPHYTFSMRSSYGLLKEVEQRKLRVKCPKSEDFKEMVQLVFFVVSEFTLASFSFWP